MGYAGSFVWEAQVDACTPVGLNRFLKMALYKYIDNPTQDGRYLLQFHLIPQSEFIWGPGEAKLCKHVIRLENFSEQFASLMRANNYRSVLDTELLHSNEGGCDGLTKD